MAYLTWLADVIREAGLDVDEVPGWRTRSAARNGMSDIRGVLLHHTAGPASGNYPSLGVVTNGRPGLTGPLAQLGLARDGTVIVVSAGLANHAGTGYAAWCGRDNGNSHLIGIEAESTGRGDWTTEQLDAYPRLVAALLKHLGLGPERAIGHKEWAPSRKIDPAGWPGDMRGFRSTTTAHMEGDVLTPEQERKIDYLIDMVDAMAPGEAGKRFDSEFAGWIRGMARDIATLKTALLTPRQSLVVDDFDGDGDKERSTVALDVPTYTHVADDHLYAIREMVEKLIALAAPKTDQN